MTNIYLDHNVIADIAGIPGRNNAERQRAHALALKAAGYRFSMSAWNIYELAKSTDDQHITQCCDFVEALEPLWVSYHRQVKAQEIGRFLQPMFAPFGAAPTPTPFNDTVQQMWASYDITVAPDVSFRGAVMAFRASPINFARVDMFANQTPAAIQIARHAHNAGVLRTHLDAIEREYLTDLLPKNFPQDQINYLVQNRKKFYAKCPTVAVEDAINELHRTDSFKPEANDGVDMQHAMVSLAYCTHFVTSDKQLKEHCRIVTQKRKLTCHVCSRVDEIEVA